MDYLYDASYNFFFSSTVQAPICFNCKEMSSSDILLNISFDAPRNQLQHWLHFVCEGMGRDIKEME